MIEKCLYDIYFGDFNKIFDCLRNGVNDYINPIPQLSFEEIKRRYAKFDERSGQLIRTACGTLIMYDGWTFEESQIHDNEQFLYYTKGKKFIPQKKFIGYRLTELGKAKYAGLDEEDIFLIIEKLIDQGEYEKVAGLTERACCWDWQEVTYSPEYT